MIIKISVISMVKGGPQYVVTISENMISERTRNNEKIKEQKVHEQTHATESQCSSILQK